MIFHCLIHRKEFIQRLKKIQSNLNENVSQILSNQYQSLRNSISESIGPYTRFVRLEQTKLSDVTGAILDVRNMTRDIQLKINKLYEIKK